MAVYAASESNLEGAPSSPMNVEPTVGTAEAKFMQLRRQLIAQGVPEDEATRMAAAQSGLADTYRNDYRRQLDEARNRPPSAEEMALRASMRPAPLDMSSTDTLPGDQPGTVRVWNDRTKQYDTVRKPSAPVAPTPDPTIGRRVGGGPAFATEEERDQYNARPAYTGAQEQEMHDAGATWAEIAEARMSPRDRDMLRVGQSGYVPVYGPSGTATYAPRAPDTPGRSGTANAATDGMMVGDAVTNRDRSTSLRRPDLEARGYVPAMVDGPNGPEMAYQLPPEELERRRGVAAQQSQARLMSRLRDAAGITNPTDEDLALTEDQLRERGRAKKLADRQAKELQWRATVMMRAGNHAGALALPGLDPAMQSAILNHQNAALNAGRSGGPINFGPTPLGVEALHNKQLTDLGLQVAQGRGFQQMTPEQRAVAEVAAQRAEGELTPEAAADRERQRSGGVLRASSDAGQRMLRQIDTEFIGFIASDREINDAVEEAVRMGIPEEDARAYFDRRRDDMFFYNPDPYGLNKPKAPAGTSAPAPTAPAASGSPTKPARPRYIPMDS